MFNIKIMHSKFGLSKRETRSKKTLPTQFICALLLLGITQSCKKNSNDAAPVFQLLRKDATGLDFENALHQTSEFNVFNYMYFFNGGGVAAGDFNNDGKIDLYFTANMGPNKMFLNEGNLKFKDVTEQANVAGTVGGWKTGVSVIDINNDGMLDLYVGQLGEYQNVKGRNQLLICKGIDNGIPTYEDEAIYYGLDLIGFSTQALFFDYDLDGDLDMFQLNHSVHHNGTFGPRKTFEGKTNTLSGDRLFRNDGTAQRQADGSTKGGFTEVTQSAGILATVIGYGLGVVAGDVNNDGYPDLYIGNDFHENDYLYINQQNGTFKELSAEQMMHTSQFSMGVEMADINNDGWTDIFSLDMLPEDPFILKSSLGEDTYDLFNYKISIGYEYQYTRNNLQLNNGDGTFSEIGLFSGVAATDWSWSPLFMDFDHDGYKDLFISNGIPRRMNDVDYVKFQENRELQLKENTNNVEDNELDIVEKMPRIKLPNKFYHNTGKLHFDDLKKQVSGDLPTFSNGAVYADFDGDGDLDVVVNNLEDEPFIYKNLFQESSGGKASYLSLELKGTPENTHAIGAKVLIYKKNSERQVEENYPVRGFLSSMQTPLHIGIGDPAGIDSIVLIWPDRTCTRLREPAFNKTETIAWQIGLPKFDFAKLRARTPAPYAFKDVTAETGLGFKHVENNFVEFNREKLIPIMVSREGPALAVADVNGDGLEDVFYGSSKYEQSALYLQTKTGKFILKTQPAIALDSTFEDVDAVFADLENDGDPDLVIASGGNEFRGKDEPMKQRAYLNDGKGNFTKADPFPELNLTASCVLPTDFNKDGLVDFFFGARAVPWKYGLTPNSHLMQNMGNGRFEDMTTKIAPDLLTAGMVKNGVWTDLDADGNPDLLLAIEWEPLTVFLNKNGKFERKVLETGSGWWNFVLPHDFDGDGDVDILAGNLGENSRLKPSAQEPVRMYVNDFDDNGQVEQVLTCFIDGKEIAFANYEDLIKTMPSLKKKFLYSKDFAKASVADIFGKDKLAKSVQRSVDNFKSMYFENTGKGLTFKGYELPQSLQFSPLTAALLADVNGDGKKEVLLGGNFYESNIEMGRYDAFYGKMLSIGAGGQMQVAPLGDIAMKGQVRRIRMVMVGGRPCYVFAKNNAEAQVLK
jgi:hypothetical protein